MRQNAGGILAQVNCPVIQPMLVSVLHAVRWIPIAMTAASIEISTDKRRLDLLAIQQFLVDTYWARGRTLEQVATSVAHSVPFGLYTNRRQIGFARVLTDYVALAYLLDVFVLPSHRNLGYGSRLIEHVLDFPGFVDVKKWTLKTRDSRSLYERHGFVAVDSPDGLMVLNR